MVERRYDPARHRELTRMILAGVLGFLLLFSVMTPVLMILGPLSAQEGIDLLQAVLAPVGTLAGAALGFYFGQKWL